MNMTWDDVEKVDQRGRKRGAPTPEEGRLIGSWTCAMGSPLCDIGGLGGKNDVVPGPHHCNVMEIQ